MTAIKLACPLGQNESSTEPIRYEPVLAVLFPICVVA